MISVLTPVAEHKPLTLVRRAEVREGEQFWSVREPKAEFAAGCMDITKGELDKRMKKANYGGAGVYWHVCLFNGDVSWNYGESMVYVNR